MGAACFSLLPKMYFLTFVGPNVTVFLFFLFALVFSLRDAQVLPEPEDSHEELDDSSPESSSPEEASESAPFLGAATVALVSPLGVGLRPRDPRRDLRGFSLSAGDVLRSRLDLLSFLFFFLLVLLASNLGPTVVRILTVVAIETRVT